MLIVRNDVARVESDLLAGSVVCPVARGGCARGVMPGLGCCGARTARGDPPAAGSVWVVPGHASSVAGLLSGSASGPGGGDRFRVGGQGGRGGLSAHQPPRSGIPAGTVRGWLRRFVSAAEAIRAHFTSWAYRLDALAGPDRPGRFGGRRRHRGHWGGGSGGDVAFRSSPGVGLGGGDERRVAAGNTSSPLAGAVT